MFKFKLTNIDSSVIKSLKYKKGILTVKFNSGSKYTYEVSELVATELYSAASKGRYFNQEIKPYYEHRKVV